MSTYRYYYRLARWIGVDEYLSSYAADTLTREDQIHRLKDASVASGDWYLASLCSRALLTTPEEDPAAHAGCAAAIARNLDQG